MGVSLTDTRCDKHLLICTTANTLLAGSVSTSSLIVFNVPAHSNHYNININNNPL